MTEKEQIEEMRKERNEIKDIMKLLDKCVSLNPMHKSEVASVLYGNNYRKAEEVRKETAKEIAQLKTALRWYMDMYGCRPERNVYDGTVEYSCNGYVTNKEDATALLKAKQTLDWFE